MKRALKRFRLPITSSALVLALCQHVQLYWAGQPSQTLGRLKKKTHLKRFFFVLPSAAFGNSWGSPPPLSTLWGRGITEVLTDTRPRKREKNTMGATLDSQSEPRRICGVFFSEAHGDVGGLSWRDQHS